MRFSIEILPEEQSQTIRLRPPCHREGSIRRAFIARGPDRFECADFELAEIQWLQTPWASRVVDVQWRWHRENLLLPQRRLAGASIDVEVLSAQKSHALLRHDGYRCEVAMGKHLTYVLVDRPSGLSFGSLRFAELSDIPRHPLPVVRITNHQVSGDFFEGLPPGFPTRPSPRRL